MAVPASASLLALPCELRNAIYTYLFAPEHSDLHPHLPEVPDPLATALKLPVRPACLTTCYNNHHAARQLRVLEVCKQIHNEAYPMALSLTPFHLRGENSSPDLFDLRTRPMSPAKIAAIRHLTLTARITHLRALNEAWAGLPFGHPCLHLDTLVVVPTRPLVCSSAYAEIADLSQSHTLAYILCETLKSLRNVACLEVHNDGCFTEIVWRLLYRSLVYRLWRWGGGKCGIRFQSGEAESGGSEKKENQWFRAYLKSNNEGVEVGEEVVRLVGLTGELPDPSLADMPMFG